ncbi:hypothetical protein Gasu2_23220 [Galdieria sulphuraria]|uniref:DUF1997 domain-containing protein n=1 Tax=Galdieria sulphuraria TaxID=130081 RepID=M2Y1L4_GALSU|nr:uncharacterized protein Gasu_29250 [Galdieria sulphuraria]EME29704.1 hypothetical protein Gasu_29250 [Galdieria sulphuraria]GJD08007.1 hypothetical protein Gasu2_23220 [Galdieria sulphuraria]|eukprot:XP_005706224.1 hypothetical protein Gasu_29250 [Galdieria sulphuraria]
MLGFHGECSDKVNLRYKNLYCKCCFHRCAADKRYHFKYLFIVPQRKKRKTLAVSKCHSIRSSMIEPDFMTFRSRELLEEPVPESESLLKEFLQSCPLRILCNSMSQQHTQVLTGQVIRARLPSIGFFYFEIVPVIELKYDTPPGTLIVRSISWDLFGLEAFGSLHDKFDLTLLGDFRTAQKDTGTVLRGKADLVIRLRYSSPLKSIPRNVVESVGQNVTETILRNVKKRIANSVVAEYSQWLAERAPSSTDSSIH